MKRSEIRKLAIQKIKEGKSRQEALMEIYEEEKIHPLKIADVVRYVPTLKGRAKYKTPHLILLILLLITIALKLVTGIFIVQYTGDIRMAILLLVPVIAIWVTIEVFLYKPRAYTTVALLAGLGILRAFQDSSSVELTNPFILGGIVLLLIIGILGLYLHFNVFSNYKENTVRYQDEQTGKKKTKKVIIFNDPDCKEVENEDVLDMDMIN